MPDTSSRPEPEAAPRHRGPQPGPRRLQTLVSDDAHGPLHPHTLILATIVIILGLVAYLLFS